MSRLDWFTIAVVTICIAAILFLLARTSILLNNENNIMSDPDTSIIDEVDDPDLDDSDIYTDETMEPDGEDEELYDDETSSDTDDDLADDYDDLDDSSDSASEGGEGDDGYTTGKNSIEESDEDEPKVNTSPSFGDAGGKYLVVAGSFQQMLNAENFVRKLQGMGYSGASVGKFNAGKYATALAGRYDAKADAKALVDELKAKGIEAYIQIKK